MLCMYFLSLYIYSIYTYKQGIMCPVVTELNREPTEIILFCSILFYSNSEELDIPGSSKFFCVNLRRSCQSLIIYTTMRSKL